MIAWETERLLLCPLTLNDLDDLYQLYSQPAVMQYVTGKPRTYEETRERLLSHIADVANHGFGYYAAILKANGAMIGRCGMKPKEGKAGLEGELAWLFAQAYWGQGLATEFARAMIPHGFAHHPITRMYATADPANIASIRVMQKVGMTFVYSNEQDVEYEIIFTKYCV